MHYVEFPALGWRFPISTGVELFGSFTIHWYGVLIALGMILAFIYGIRRAKDFDLNVDAMLDIALVTIPIAILGARLYYVLSPNQIDQYLANPLSMLYIWEGGLGIYGGVIFAFVFGPLICRWRKQSPLAMMDIASLGFLIGQAIGRWGNFVNQEAFGGNTTLPWGMTGDIIQAGTHGTGYDTALPVHPTFLYESLWCALGFLLLHIVSKRFYQFKGQIFCGYIVWYGIGRFLIESTRTDSLVIGTMKTSQLVAAVAVIGGGIAYWLLSRRAKALPKTIPADPADTNKEDTTHGNEN